jgi:DNA polymerase family A
MHSNEHFLRQQFDQVYVVDFEFKPSGQKGCTPWCVVIKDALSSQAPVKLWLLEHEFDSLPRCPVNFSDPRSLFVAFSATAEIGAFLDLKWPEPVNVLDLFAEWRNIKNGVPGPKDGWGETLVFALNGYGLSNFVPVEKGAMRELAIRGGPFTYTEKQALLDYCEEDVIATERLLWAMLPDLRKAALARGSYQRALTRVIREGTPMDVQLLTRIQDRWPEITRALQVRAAEQYGVYRDGAWHNEDFDVYLRKAGIPWRRTSTGLLNTDDKYFKEQAEIWPELGPLREIRKTLNAGRMIPAFEVESDGVSRCYMHPFKSSTGRNQPKASEYSWLISDWFREVIQPRPGESLVEIDWAAQEYAIAAYLSGDPAMIDAYRSGDPYIWLAIASRAVPKGATKKSHPVEREAYKIASLAILYGMGQETLAKRLKSSKYDAWTVLSNHKRIFARYWEWQDETMYRARYQNQFIETHDGWRLRLFPTLDKHSGRLEVNDRQVSNFPMQGGGAAQLRAATRYAVLDYDLRVSALIHDSMVLACPFYRTPCDTELLIRAMDRASEFVCGKGNHVRTEVTAVTWPSHLGAKKQSGKTLWKLIQQKL